MTFLSGCLAGERRPFSFTGKKGRAAETLGSPSPCIGGERLFYLPGFSLKDELGQVVVFLLGSDLFGDNTDVRLGL